VSIGTVTLASILVLWFGFKLLFLPLRLSWRLARALAGQMRPATLTLLLVWTVIEAC